MGQARALGSTRGTGLACSLSAAVCALSLCSAASAAAGSLATASGAVSSSPAAAITMAAALSLMQQGREAVAEATRDSKEDEEAEQQQQQHDDTTPPPAPRKPSNLESYLASQAPPASEAADAWLADDFTPVTTSLVQAVREIRLGDVKWFLRQIEIKTNAGKAPEITSPSSNGRSPTATAASSADAAVVPVPSPLLDTLPASALSLPTSGPYIMDILFDSIVGLQAQLQLASVRTTKAANRLRAQQEKVELRLIDLLTPLPPVMAASLALPSPAKEDAFAIMQALVRAVDVVGGTVLSSSACIDYLKLSSVPYPIMKDNMADAAEAVILSPKSPDAVAADLSVGWSVTKEWTKRVQLLEQFGAVMDVNRTQQEEESLASPAVKQRAAASAKGSPAAVTPAALSVTQLHPVLLSSPPALSSFVHPPFTLDSKASQEKYLQHTYLSLLAKRQLFLQMLTDEVDAVKSARAVANSVLIARSNELESRDSKIISDVAKFESEKEALETAAATATTQAQMDAIKVEQLERDTRATLEAEWRAHRESVAIRGARLVHRDEHELERQFEEANARLQETRVESVQSMAAVDEARARLRDINLQYERVAIALESAQSRIDGVASRATQMEGYVSAFETSVKQARKALKETHVLVDQSRASTARLSVVELEMRGKGVWLIFGGQLQLGVSNLFLKFFRCMTGPPDPREQNPEVVWDPEPCYVSELCSPSATRSLEQLRNPSWRTVKIDLWKLCAAENGRYFKVEVWDCDASVKAVASVVKGALDQAKNEANAAAQAAAQAAQAGLAENAPAVLNPDGTVQKPAPVARGPVNVSSVTLPSTTAIKYQYIGQAVMTLQHLYDAQAKRESDASVSQGGLYAVPIINAERWANRASNPYTDSGTLIVQSMRVVEK